jgi:SAM-dependent methyltransferase
MTAVPENPVKTKPDYGIDSPYIITGMLILAAASFSVGWLRPHLFHISLRWVAIVISLYFLQGAASMLYYSKVGKLRVREDFLNSIPWRGDERVLDVGCGRGLLLIAAARRLKTGCAIGVDMWLPKAMTGNVPSAALENAAIEGVRDHVEVKEADARKLPFPDASFDIVISNFVLHEMETSGDRDRMVKEIARVLKPGGCVALRDFIFTDTCVATLRTEGIDAKRTRVGTLSFWLAAILNFGFFRLYQVNGTKVV